MQKWQRPRRTGAGLVASWQMRQNGDKAVAYVGKRQDRLSKDRERGEGGRRRWDKDAEYSGGVKWPVDSSDK